MKLLFLLLCLASASQISLGQTSENDILKNVVMAESDAFYDRNVDAWQNTWLHTDKISRTIIYDDKYTTLLGWNNYGPDVLNFLKNNKKEDAVSIKNDSFEISSNEDLAWVEYRQTATTKGKDSDIVKVTKEYRVLAKDNNQWKILSMITHVPAGAAPMSSSDLKENLTATGDNLMNANRPKDAIAVFKLNAKLNPHSPDAYNNLSEAYVTTGKKRKAIKSYKKSVKVNPETAGNKREAIKTYKKSVKDSTKDSAAK